MVLEHREIDTARETEGSWSHDFSEKVRGDMM